MNSSSSSVQPGSAVAPTPTADAFRKSFLRNTPPSNRGYLVGSSAIGLVVTGQTVNASVAFNMAVQTPAHVGHVDHLLSNCHLADFPVARRAINARLDMRFVLKVDHR